MVDRNDSEGVNFAVTLVVMVVVGLAAAVLFLMLSRMDRSPKAAGAPGLGADAIANLSHRP